MTTLLLTPRQTPDTLALARVAREAGLEVIEPKSWQEATTLYGLDRERTIVYGGDLFTGLMADLNGITGQKPNPFWLTTLPHPYTRRLVRATTLDAARDLLEVEEKLFIKPAREKGFPARVYVAGEEVGVGQPEDLDVLVSDPASFDYEVRVFLAKGRAVTTSLYAMDGKPVDEPWNDRMTIEMAKVAEQAFANSPYGSTLPNGVVIDVGQLASGHWVIIEANAAHESGLYGCDPKAALYAIALAFDIELTALVP